MMMKKMLWKDDGSAIQPTFNEPVKYSIEELQMMVGDNPVDMHRALDAQILQEKLHKALTQVNSKDARPMKRMPSWMR